ncbi:MAG: hypothetical protein ABII96_02055 [Candidatus Zixiibacteriota bacterium]
MFTTLMRDSRWYVAILIAASAIMLFAAGAVFADVTVQRLVKSSGLSGFGAFETTEKMMISNDKECTQGITKYSGKFSSLMNKGAKEATSITRLDKELIWNVDSDKKTYTELTFDQMKQMMESMSALLSNPAKQDSLRKAMEKLSTTVDVNKTGEKKTIAGLECERVILSLEGVHVDTIVNTTDTTWVKNDVWITPMKNVPSELYDFDMKMAEKMGFTEGGPMAGLLNQYADAMKKLQDKLKELNGYPLASTFSIVTTTHAQEKQKAEVKSEEVEKQEKETEEETSVTEKKDVKSALGGLFNKKAKEEAKKKEAEKQKEKAAQEQAQLGQPKTVMEITSETQNIETGSIEPSIFEIPAGYKKVETPGLGK